MSLGPVRHLRVWLMVTYTRLKYSTLAMDLFSVFLLTAGRLFIRLSRRKASALIMRAHRNARAVERQLKIESLLKSQGLFTADIVGGLVPTSFRHEQFFEGRVLPLKETTTNEKGVLIVKFSETFSKLRRAYDVGKILEDYYVVLEPSYSGFCDPEVLYFMEYPEKPVIVQAADQMDFNFIARLESNLVPINTGSSDWTNDRVFRPLGLEKKYDCIMVALWNDIKRHYMLMRAIRDLGDPTYRACLVGGGWGRIMTDYQDMAAYYGITQNLDFFEKVPSEEVNRLLNLSKLNVLLTLKEGANKSIFEGFFADVPGLILDTNIGVNRRYLNEHTGLIVSENDLPEVLQRLRTQYTHFTPRRWALEHISCEATTRKLENLVKEIAAERGEPFTGSLAVKVNPELDYYHDDNRLPPFNYARYQK